MRQLFFLLAAALSLQAEQQELPSSLIIPDTSSLEIATPSFKERQVVKVRLANELEAYIVSDPQLKESALSISVAAGQWNDSAPGIAHFTEHMLFLGSKNYPKPDEFMQFIGDNGGYTNAFTSSSQTTYLFSVRNHAFEEATRRIADFFTNPLFDPSGIADERNAVDQEFARTVNKDFMRLYYIEKNLASNEHPHQQFGCGNLKTLGRLKRDDVVKFFEENYSANLMRIALYSPRPLKELKELVETEFSQIPNRHLSPKTHPARMITPERKGQLVYLPSRQETRLLQIQWEIPSHLVSSNTSHMTRLISSILSTEGKGSLLTELKEEGLATGVDAGMWRMDQTSALFMLHVDLTRRGVDMHRDVISKVYSHLAALRAGGIPSALYGDMCTSRSLAYTYQTPKQGFEAVSSDSRAIFYESLSTYPKESVIPAPFDPDQARQLLSALSPRQAAISCIAPAGSLGYVPNQTEPWSGAEYALEKISPEQIRTWENTPPTPNFKLPKLNPYLPKSLPAIAQTSAVPTTPERIEDSSAARAYHAHDAHFFIPKLSATFSIKTPKTEVTSPRAAAYLKLLVAFLDDQSEQTSYLAGQANMQTSFSLSRGALDLHVCGWSPTAPDLLKAQLQTLKNLEITSERFSRIKEKLLSDLRSSQRTSPSQIAASTSSKILAGSYQPSEVERALAPLQQADFARFYKSALSSAFVESVICGPHTPEVSRELKDLVLDSLAAKPYPPTQHPAQKALLLPTDSGPLAVRQKFSLASNAAWLHIQPEDQTLESQVILDLLSRSVKPLFFEELRTNQQTGYANHVFVRKDENVATLVFAVESSTHSPDELIARYELFLEEYLRKVETNLSPERFEVLRSTLIETYAEPPRNLVEMNDQLSTMAFKYSERFDLLNEKIEIAKNLTQPGLIAAAKQILGRDNPRRLAILVEGDNSTDDLRYKMMKSPGHIQRSGLHTSFAEAQIFRP